MSLLGHFPHADLDQRAGIKWWWIHNFNFQHKFKVLPKRLQRTKDELTFVTSGWLDHQVTPQLKSLLPWCSVEPRPPWPGIQEPPPTNTPSCQTWLPRLHARRTRFTVPQGYMYLSQPRFKALSSHFYLLNPFKTFPMEPFLIAPILRDQSFKNDSPQEKNLLKEVIFLSILAHHGSSVFTEYCPPRMELSAYFRHSISTYQMNDSHLWHCNRYVLQSALFLLGKIHCCINVPRTDRGYIKTWHEY